MKTPRVEDFDPNAAPSLGSPLDNYPRIEKPKPSAPPAQVPVEVSQPPTAVEATKQPNVRTNEGTNQRSNERTNVRTKIRHTFDIYSDQLMSLREIALKREATFGKRTLLGDLVQEALDLFLTKERNIE